MLYASRLAITGCMVTALISAELLSGCTSSPSEPERTVSIAVQPDSSLADQPVRIEITGLSPGEIVNVQLSSTDALGVPWHASAAYRTDERGDGPAWTLHGQALPHTSEFDNPSPTDDPAAVIPDQRIQGPVFLDCGEADQTWTSCPYAQAIVGLLDAHHDRWAHVRYAYPGAGHPVGELVPYEPTSPVTDPDYATD